MAKERHARNGGEARGLRYSQEQMTAHAGRLIAVVEDEETIREAMLFALRREGYRAEAVRRRPRRVGRRSSAPFPIWRSSTSACRVSTAWISAAACAALSESLPIVFVTSREDEFDRVLGLEIGADDYICKPFSMRELMARVKVLLRRAALVPGSPVSTAERAVTIGELVLDPLRLTAVWKGTPVPLTVTEFLLLLALARRPGIVKTREQLMEEVYPDRVAVSDRTIDSHVKRIRRKFESIDRTFIAVEGVYGAGYRYVGHGP